MFAVEDKAVIKQQVKFDRKRMITALKSQEVVVPPNLTRERKRALILSHA